MKTRIMAAAAGLLLSVASSAHAAVVNFSGSDGGRSVTGTLTYDPSAPIRDYGENEFFDTSLSEPGELSFKWGNLERSGGYVLIVGDAHEGNSKNYTDSLNAAVEGGRESYALSFNYPDATSLNTNELPSAFPTGLGEFFYRYGGTEYYIPVTLTSAVPEAATWAMMIMGFGFIGFAMRRRQADHGMVPSLAA